MQSACQKGSVMAHFWWSMLTNNTTTENQLLYKITLHYRLCTDPQTPSFKFLLMLTYLFEIWLLENHLMVSVHHLMLEVVPSPPYCNVDCPKSCLSSATNMEIMSNSLHIGGPPSPSIDGSGRRWKGTQSSGRLPPDCIDPNRASLRMLVIYTLIPIHHANDMYV